MRRSILGLLVAIAVVGAVQPAVAAAPKPGVYQVYLTDIDGFFETTYLAVKADGTFLWLDPVVGIVQGGWQVVRDFGPAGSLWTASASLSIPGIPNANVRVAGYYLTNGDILSAYGIDPEGPFGFVAFWIGPMPSGI